ncbi:MAG: hypothetical protein ACOZB3_08825 [Calditrichota bacterium]
MITHSRSINQDLLSFWYEYAAPGRVGLLDIDAIIAKLIGWAERRVTPNHEPSPWTHVFIFAHPRHGIPWIAESDINVPLPGFRPKPNRPQRNPIYKWSHPAVVRAAVLETNLSEDSIVKLNTVITRLTQSNLTYRVSELVEAAIALVRQDLGYRTFFHRYDAMHCAHFIRECLRALNSDPLAKSILPENTVPEHFAQVYPIIAEWTRPPDQEHAD